MALYRLIVFVFAGVALAGCCATGTGCPAPLPPELAATDGLVSSRDDNREPGVPSIAVGESKARMRVGRNFAEQDAMEQESYAELNKHLQICKGCGPAGRDKMASGGDDNMTMNDGMKDGMNDTMAAP